MTANSTAMIATRLSLCALLMATWTASQGGEPRAERPDSFYENTDEISAIEDTLEPLSSRMAGPPLSSERPQPRASQSQGKRAGTSSKASTIHIAHRRTPGSQFDQIEKALLQGNTTSAIEAYESLLKDDPRNTDALLGLASIHLNLGNNATAETLIYQALTISPREGLGLALLSPLRAAGNPTAEESRLQQALADLPDSAPLHFALANLYAKQNRWREAQQAYFKATINDHDHPDYLFNLAVSLEHLNQPQAAKQQYQAALAATALRAHAFSRTLASSRIDYLERGQP